MFFWSLSGRAWGQGGRLDRSGMAQLCAAVSSVDTLKKFSDVSKFSLINSLRVSYNVGNIF